MSTREDSARTAGTRLFQTLPHPCGYYPERLAQNLVIDPAAPDLVQLYPQALAHGFRRAGGHLYRPNCPGCQACVPSRIPVQHFRPDRSQRRCARRNADLEIIDAAPGYSRERYRLYRDYLHHRHTGGGMEADAEDFAHFLAAPWSPTRFLEFRLHGRLLAVAVTDCCRPCLSAVYTFFDPAETARSLGTFAILSQIAWARRTQRTHLYLGYWISGHPKMDYKRRFQPMQRLQGDTWVEMAS